MSLNLTSCAATLARYMATTSGATQPGLLGELVRSGAASDTPSAQAYATDVLAVLKAFGIVPKVSTFQTLVARAVELGEVDLRDALLNLKDDLLSAPNIAGVFRDERAAALQELLDARTQQLADVATGRAVVAAQNQSAVRDATLFSIDLGVSVLARGLQQLQNALVHQG